MQLAFLQSKEFIANVADSFKKKELFTYDHRGSFIQLKEGLPSKDEYYNTLNNRAISDKNHEFVLNV